MSRTIRFSLLLIVSVSIVVFTIIGLGRDIFHAIEEITYDHQATVLTNSAFSRLTNKVALLAGSISLFLIPFYVTCLVDKNYKLSSVVYSLKFVCSFLLIVVMVLVVIVFFPLSCVLQGFEEGFHSVFLGDCLYSHVLIPLLFVLSFFMMDDRQKLSRKEPIVIASVLTAYVLVYVFFVFGLKTWEDFYFIKEAANTISYFAMAPFAILVIVGVYFLSGLLAKLVSRGK